MPARIRTRSLRSPDSNRAVLDDVLLGKAAAAAPEALLVRRNLEVLNMERSMREVRAQN